MTDTAKPEARHVSAGAAHQFDWGSIQWLVSDRLDAGAGITFGHVEIKAGSKNPRHLHPNCDEVLYLMEGELDHSLDGQVVRLRPGMSLFIPANAEHDAVNVSNVVARMVVAYSSGDRQTVMLEAGQE
jgi:quercetin dioxygenase-like cupin family protein